MAARMDNSLLRELNEEQHGSGAAKDKSLPSTQSRAVKNGHYVRVSPEPLSDPELVAVSPAMCVELGLDLAEAGTPRFAHVFAGAPATATGVALQAWATAYGVSVNGHSATNSPFGPWGYGDGRAMSIGEVVHEGHRWELQLKGAGRTPFARRFDGRAVLRSSVREFLASEAMHALGVPTTRALALVSSRTERVARAWYPSPDANANAARQAPHPPSCLVEERTAVLCRCAPSFLRVGHVELLALRGDAAELEALLWHTIRREYPHLLESSPSLPEALIALFGEFLRKQAQLVAEWLRVGYVQGNMNSDNCLLSGRTLDYGPFGFMEVYDPAYQPFTSDAMGNYAFARQPLAAQKNAATLASALLAAVPAGGQRDDCGAELRRALEEDFPEHFRQAHGEGCRRKLGLAAWDDDARDLWGQLLELMQSSAADFTVLFRLLATCATPRVDSLGALLPAFADGAAPAGKLADAWCAWLARFGARVEREAQSPEARSAEMRAASPKYIPRNWVLFEAYEAAERGDFAPVQGILDMLSHPYEEQPEFEEAYFRPAPPWARSAGGLTFMS